MRLPLGLSNLGRLRTILSVLVIDYGFGSVFDQLGVANLLPLGRRRGPALRYPQVPGPARLRLALAELGPTFIKLGQVLSARSDMLPPAVVRELRHLQDEAPALPFDQVRGAVETELGRPLEQAFARFDREPLSAASLGQVHGARLRDGREVTVKVLRPGARSLVEADLQILVEVARLVHRQVPSLRPCDLPGLVRQFADQMQDELNYTLEAHNADRLRHTLADAGARIRVPEVVWELTTRQLLTTEWVHGRRVDRLADLSFDRAAAARELGQSLLHQVFVDGFFHGDPHQGNVLFGDDGTIMLLDFGLMGSLDPRSRRLLGELFWHVYQDDVDGVIETMAEMGTIGGDTDLMALRGDLATLTTRFVTLPRRDFPLGELLTRILRALWLHQVRVPVSLSLAAKAVLMTEAICSELDPGFDFRELAPPVIQAARARDYTASALMDRGARAARAAARRLARAPARVDRVLSLMEQGGLRVRAEDPGAEVRWGNLARAVNRLSLSVLSAALVLSGSCYVSLARHPAHLGLGLVALAGGVILGAAVVLSLMRPGRV